LGPMPKREKSENGLKLKAKALMVIDSLCPISVEEVIRGLKWGIGPKGTEAFSSHHIWMFILSIGQHPGEGDYRRSDVQME
jgi:hypothetical protein